MRKAFPTLGSFGRTLTHERIGVRMEQARQEKNSLTVLLTLALLVRIYMAFQTPVIAKDGTVYVQNAIYLSVGNIEQGLVGYPPGYPLLIALAYRMIGNGELAGQAVSVLFGSLSILPFFFLTKDIFGRQIAWIASFLFLFQPFLVQHSGEVMSESVYIFFFISTTYAAWRALRYKKTRSYLAVGILSALAYLTRPEGVGLLIAFVAWLPFHLWIQRTRLSPRMAGQLLCTVLIFAILAAPYLVHVRKMTGEWRLNAKRSMIVDSGLRSAIEKEPEPGLSEKQSSGFETKAVQPPRSEPYPGWVETDTLLEFFARYLKTLFLSIVKFTAIFHQFLFAFLIYFMFKRKYFSYHYEGELFLNFLAILCFLGIALLYVSGRHLLQIVPLYLPWAAAGLIELSMSSLVLNVTTSFKRYGWRGSSRSLLVLLTFFILLPKTLAPHRTDKLILREAAEWIRSREIASPLILSTDSRVAYYTPGRHMFLADFGEIVSVARTNKPDFIVIEKDASEEIPAEALQGVKEVFQTQSRDGSYVVTVYVLVPT